ncbi:MAG TPA: hypothetical protein VIY09_03670 [Rhizomicrobium sp.]
MPAASRVNATEDRTFWGWLSAAPGRSLTRCAATGIRRTLPEPRFGGLEHDAAGKDCETAVERNATDEIVLQGRGVTEFKRADWPAALAEFDLVLSRQPNAVESLYMKGIVEHRMGNASAGDADIAAAKAIESRVAAAYAEYGILP